MKKRVTFNIEASVYKDFQDFCEKNDIIISKRVEKLLISHIEENKVKNKGEKR
jgi:hypothetical protein